MSLPATLGIVHMGTADTDTLWYFFGDKWPIIEQYIQQGEYEAFRKELLQYFESHSENQYTTSSIINLLQNIIDLLPKKPAQWTQWVLFAMRSRTWLLRRKELQEIQILNAFASLLSIFQTGNPNLPYSWKNISDTLREGFELWCYQNSSIHQ